MTKLNKTRLCKVRTLMERGATEGEREAARQSAEAMAKKAGCTLEEAFEYADRPAEKEVVATASVGSMFEAFFNSPEMRMERMKREQERAAARAELLERFGSVEAVMAETENERALREATADLAEHKAWIDEDGSVHPYVSTLAGWSSCGSRDKLPASLRAAVSRAVPLPDNVAGLYAELRAMDEVRSNREKFVQHYEPPIEINAREYVLEDLMEATPALAWPDVEARFAWARWMSERGLFRYHDAAFLDRAEADVREILGGLDRAKLAPTKEAASEAVLAFLVDQTWSEAMNQAGALARRFSDSLPPGVDAREAMKAYADTCAKLHARDTASRGEGSA